jgi:hypothetical protein
MTHHTGAFNRIRGRRRLTRIEMRSCDAVVLHFKTHVWPDRMAPLRETQRHRLLLPPASCVYVWSYGNSSVQHISQAASLGFALWVRQHVQASARDAGCGTWAWSPPRSPRSSISSPASCCEVSTIPGQRWLQVCTWSISITAPSKTEPIPRVITAAWQS